VLSALRGAGVSAALAFRSAPPGRAAAFTSILEVTRSGDLVVSFVQHMAVRRKARERGAGDEREMLFAGTCCMLHCFACADAARSCVVCALLRFACARACR
jgi:hypothetical protein